MRGTGSQSGEFESSHVGSHAHGQSLEHADGRSMSGVSGGAGLGSQGFESGPPESDVSNEDFLFHLYRGSELLQDNRVHEAKEELERALHLQPKDPKGQDLLAVVYFRLGLYPRAISIYEQLRKKNQRDTALLLNLALCYLKTGQAALARRDLEQLLSVNPNHVRAWGYLGLACERLGELTDAERAFQNGGHAQMARRIAERRSSAVAGPLSADEEAIASREARDVVAAAFEELDAGELSFALAEPASDNHAARGSWRPVELGRSDENPNSARVQTKKPDTKDGPPPAALVPQLGGTHTEERRPTLIVGVPPAAEAADLAALRQVPSPRSPLFSLDDSGAPSLRRPMVMTGVRVPAPSQKPAPLDEPTSKRTLPPPGRLTPPPRTALRETTPPPPALRDADARMGHADTTYAADIAPARSHRKHDPPSGAQLAPPNLADVAAMEAQGALGGASSAQYAATHFAPASAVPLPAAVPVTHEEFAPTYFAPANAAIVAPPQVAASNVAQAGAVGGAMAFPPPGQTLLHPSGLALVRTSESAGFAARLEAIRVSSNGLGMSLLERTGKAKGSASSFGGVGSPMVRASGDGQLVLGPRAGRKLFAFALVDDVCFVREDYLIGWDLELNHESGRLATGDGESVALLQLRGRGVVILEAIGDILPLDISGDQGLSIRREVAIGWFGRLVPRALPASEAPCGQNGLVSFAGEGRVLVAGL